MAPTAFEAFLPTDAQIGEFVFYGLRSVDIVDHHVQLVCGYLQPGKPPAGQLKITMPARDITAENCAMLVYLTVNHWSVGIKNTNNGAVFIYMGTITPSPEDRIDIEYPDDPNSVKELVSL